MTDEQTDAARQHNTALHTRLAVKIEQLDGRRIGILEKCLKLLKWCIIYIMRPLGV